MTLDRFGVALRCICPAVVLAAALAGAVPAAAAAENLLQVTTRDTGIAEFDMAITEIRRESRVSVLTVAGFHSRPQAGTRWLMCMANTLAVLRGFEYWTIVYPEAAPDETVLVGFPSGPKDRMADRDPRFASKWALQIVAPIERGVRLCKR